MNHFTNTLIRLRREKGYSQEQLADLTDVSRQAVSKWEAGQSMPDLNRLLVLADLFGVSLDELVREPSAMQKKNDDEINIVAAGNTVRVPAGTTVHVTSGYEYKSKTKILGVPLVHINTGYGWRVAKGIIAIGNVAVGVVSLGGITTGIVSFGGIAVGVLGALGGLALGTVALGGAAVGVLAIGGCAVGVYAMGGCAVGARVAVGGGAFAPVSVGANRNAGLVVTQQTTRAMIRAYLETSSPNLPRVLLRLLSLGA